ncbi:hypothetical protein F0L17_16395 [Streptomyces sp. TRM43335]|uniref:Integral membrane protein n=1 Tax=Streptomyces taklimakanensis TaxID=2569853 RepID=A0A6G2BEJ2_9ACTN|nr:hypothetical protein [Streptomyces taklimakanensis]MTE20660.1 hypothetical protein [Streptomyces taklimakanensis]
MTDRRRRAALATPTGIPTGIPTGTAPVPFRLRMSPSDPSGSSGASGGEGNGSRGGTDDNPFAPPPEDRPEQPWRPRLPADTGRDGANGDGGDDRDRGDGSAPEWGGRWSSRQPRRQSGGFGGADRPEAPGGGTGPGGRNGMRWDPTDPVQRRARYALLAGMWGVFFALFGLTWLAAPLGALAVYWGVVSLRSKPGADGDTGGTNAPRAAARPEDVAGSSGSPAPSGTAGPSGGSPSGASAWDPAARRSAAGQPGRPGQGPRPQTAAAVSGLVTGVVALLIIAAQFTVQLVYRDYFVCVEDALTNSSRQACDRHLPEELRPFFGEQDE